MYFTLLDIGWILALGTTLWFWWSAVGAKQRALLAVKKHCDSMNVQLLDEAVSLTTIKLRRNAQGRLSFWRRYSFEFSSTGDDRFRGWVELHGYVVSSVQLGVYRI